MKGEVRVEVNVGEYVGWEKGREDGEGVAGEFGNPKRHLTTDQWGEPTEDGIKCIALAAKTEAFYTPDCPGVIGPQFRLDDERLHTAKSIFDICYSGGEIYSPGGIFAIGP